MYILLWIFVLIFVLLFGINKTANMLGISVKFLFIIMLAITVLSFFYEIINPIPDTVFFNN